MNVPSVFSEPMIGGFLGLPIIVPFGPALKMAPPPPSLWNLLLSFCLNLLSSLCFLFCLIIELLTFSKPIRFSIRDDYTHLLLVKIAEIKTLHSMLVDSESLSHKHWSSSRSSSQRFDSTN